MTTEKKEKNLFTDITDSTKFLEGLNEYATALIKSNEKFKEHFPHLIFSHGFQRWHELLIQQFPAFRWWGKEEILEEVTESKDAYDKFERFLFDRFFVHLTSMSTFQWLGKEEKKELREKGWQGYCED